MKQRIESFRMDAGNVVLEVHDCWSCGVIFGITAELSKRRQEDHGAFHCPNGHAAYFNGPTQAEKDAKAAREQAEWLRAQLCASRDQERAAKAEAAEAKASEVRLRWRVGNGVCPCCNRSFPALAAHVATKHPEFTGRELSALSDRMRELLVTIKRNTDEQDAAAVPIGQGTNRATVRALESRGLVARVGWDRVSLTDAGWPLAEHLSGHPGAS